MLYLMLILNLALIAIVCFFVFSIWKRANPEGNGAVEKAVREELRQGREESSTTAKQLREEVATGFKTSGDSLVKTMSALGTTQKEQLEGVAKQLREQTESNQKTMEGLRNTVDLQLKQLRESNEKKIDEMRKTVDEKLQGTLEKRLGASFALVGKQLESVQRGLGEMQNLANGVGELKRVLTNVKARGTWAEVQLGAILEQMLSPSQFERNVRTKDDSSELVEFAIRLPGSHDDPESCIWLPIDSKFPQEDYVRLQNASDAGDATAVQDASDALARAVRLAAQTIQGKYLNPPATTDFAIMFLATEGLYAEVLRHPHLASEIQNKYRIVIAGPTTLAAIVSSLRMGFQTLAIEKQASEVWKVLAAVKTEFGKFGGVLDKVQKQLGTVTNTIEDTKQRARAMERRLRTVEQLPEAESTKVLDLTIDEFDESDDTQNEGNESP